MIHRVHVRHARAEPVVATRGTLAREFPRGRQSEDQDTRQSDGLAGGEGRGAAAGAARRDACGRRRPLGDRAVAAARSCRRGAGHAAADRSRPLWPRRPERLATLALALIAARVVEPAAKLATARQLSEATASHSLGAVLGLGEVDEELYRALDLLGAAQPAIEKALARRHLKDGTLVLYDVTSSYLEGRCCELAR